MTTLSFKVRADEANLIREKAKQARLSLSEYLRRQATAKTAAVAGKVRRIRCPHTGAMIFSQPALTSEAVRKMLVDFP